jgi:hypothetical protein
LLKTTATEQFLPLGDVTYDDWEKSILNKDFQEVRNNVKKEFATTRRFVSIGPLALSNPIVVIWKQEGSILHHGKLIVSGLKILALHETRLVSTLTAHHLQRHAEWIFSNMMCFLSDFI